MISPFVSSQADRNLLDDPTRSVHSPRTTVSSSVDAGLASHEKPITLNMLASMSPRMAGGEECAGYHAKNLPYKTTLDRIESGGVRDRTKYYSKGDVHMLDDLT